MNLRTFRHALRGRHAATAASVALSCIALAAGYSGSGDSLAHAQRAPQVQPVVQAIRPGTIPTKADGYTMRAKINGKEWTAVSMMPLQAADRVIGYRGDSYIGFGLRARSATVGKPIAFSENNAADLSIEGDDAFWGGRTGEMVITKMDAQWIEGTFRFTATSQSSGSSKKVEVTDGVFRAAMPGR
jgi:hypothetical protein